MNIQRLYIKNFRNISNLEIDLKKGVIILYGTNGQGKTNFVESIYVLSKTNSFRTSHNKELICFDTKEALVSAKLKKQKGELGNKILLTNQGKTCFVNKNKVNKVSEYLGKLNAISFTPEDVNIFKETPRSRRWFMDSELSSLFPLYVKQLIVFQKVLEERNAFLKQNKATKTELLEVIDDKLLDCSFDLYQRRKWLIEKISQFASVIYQKITNKKVNLQFVYRTFLDCSTKEEYISKGKEFYRNNFEKDFEKTFTQNGIQKDDFIAYLDEKEVSMYASQGQQRLVSLAMKLALAAIVSNVNKEEPIIILDDVFSELDKEKRENLLNYIINKEQVFITCTNYQEVISNENDIPIQIIKIQQGNVVERGVLLYGRKQENSL